MKGLLEKIKSLDNKKKIIIGVIALIIAVAVVILAVLFGGKDTEVDKDDDKTKVEQNDDKDKDDEKNEEDTDKEEATFTVKVVDADGTAVAGVVVQVCKDECVPATTDETGVATFKVEITEGYKLSVVSCPEGYEYTGGEVALTAGLTEYELKIQKKAEGADGGNTGNGSGQTAVQQPTTTNPSGEEILGAGSKDQPYLEIPNLDTMSITTVSIPAGKTLYYGIQRVGGMILTINDASAYVIESNGTRHNASGGKVTFAVEDALASDYVYFQIGNNSGSAKSFTIKFFNQTGSYQNPEVVSAMGTFKKSLAAGNEIGYYYKYTAGVSGIIKFYVKGTKASSISVTNNNNSVNRTTDAESDVKTDANGTYVELEVNSGDEILILIHAQRDAKGRYPATDITWWMQK